MAGGRSSRFGSDKATATLAGRSLADLSRALLLPHVECAVIAGRDGEIPDMPGPDLGPLGGIAGALHHAAQRGFDTVLTIGCDMPRLPDGLLLAIAGSAPRYCPDAPVLGHWPVALGPGLLAYIETAPNRSVRRWASAIHAAPIAADGAIPNINTPRDLEAL